MLSQCVFLKKKKHRKGEKLKRKSSGNWRGREKKKKKEEEKKQKAEARVLKSAERHAKQGEKGRRGPKRKAPSRKDGSVNDDDAENEDHDENGSGAEPVRKKTRVVNKHAHETCTIDTNQCCVCFIHYQEDVAEANGRNWIPAAVDFGCMRIVH